MHRITPVNVLLAIIYALPVLFSVLYLCVLVTIWHQPGGSIFFLLGSIIYVCWLYKLSHDSDSATTIWYESTQKAMSYDHAIQPLFETVLYTKKKVCFACGEHQAKKVLRTQNEEIVPLCSVCSANWNVYGYNILKSVPPKELTKRVVIYSLTHPFSCQPFFMCLIELRRFGKWAQMMKRLQNA